MQSLLGMSLNWGSTHPEQLQSGLSPDWGSTTTHQDNMQTPAPYYPPKPQSVNGQSTAGSTTVPCDSNIDLDFAQWAMDTGLNRVSITILIANDCSDLGALALLTKDDVKLLGLTVGQHARLWHGIIKLKAKQETKAALATQSARAQIPGPLPPRCSNGTDIENNINTQPLESSLDHLLASMAIADTTKTVKPKVNSTPQAGACAQPSFLRPEMYLQTSLLGNSAAKHLDIIDYVTRGVLRSEEEVIASGGGFKMVVKAGPSKPKLDTVTPTQWLAANARIMAELLATEVLSSSCVCQYLAYTCKVGDLAERFDWKSVLSFDREYRILQAAHNIPWGMDTSHLITTLLREKPPAQFNQGYGNLYKNNRSGHVAHYQQEKSFGQARPSSGYSNKEICKLYNRGRCAYPNCRYEHLCSVPGCGRSHPETEHKSA